jgi:hypothetical protein
MGLMYIYPTDIEDSDRTRVSGEQRIELRTYGLPYVFWGYFAAISIVVLAMFLVSNDPLQKLIQTGDTINIILGYTVYATLAFVPLSCLILLFLEKRMIKTRDQISLKVKLAFIPLYSKTIKLKTNGEESLVIKHYLESPNVAKMQSNPDLRGFENKGYYELYAITVQDREVRIDRHSRKADLVKIRSLLSKY